MKKITDLVAELAAPAVAEQGCELWDVEYVKEAGTWYLRLYLDKEGGVDILDCEAVSRKVSDLLDEADPIEGSYTFEVSSAGCERPLKRPSDFARFMGSPVTVRLYRIWTAARSSPAPSGATTTAPSPSRWAARSCASRKIRWPCAACGWNFKRLFPELRHN